MSEVLFDEKRITVLIVAKKDLTSCLNSLIWISKVVIEYLGPRLLQHLAKYTRLITYDYTSYCPFHSFLPHPLSNTC